MLHHHPVSKKPKITRLNNYRPVALTSVVMKSFERLVLAYLKASTGPLLDPLQFAHRANRSVDDAVNIGLHFILQHLDRPGTYVRILFVDLSSAFNTITLQNKLTQFSVPTSICQWITSFLTDRQQLVRRVKCSSSTRTISTGAPQGCVLSPLLFSLYANDCTSKEPSVKLLKFADDTTLIGLIQKKAQQRLLYFLRQLRKFNLPQELLIQFYSAIIESVLCTSITVWFSSATKSDLRRLQRVVQTAELIISTTLHTLLELYSSRVSKRADKITQEHIQHTPSLNRYVQWTLHSSEHQNDQTQEQFLSPSNPSHEHLTLNMEHTTLLYNYLFTTILIFSV